MKLKLERPLVFFDLETTGIDVTTERVVEISLLKLFPDGTGKITTLLVNPGKEIPAEASKVHGIYDLMVANEPSFKDIANSLLEIFKDSDISGYNILNYDLPLIRAEFKRCGIEFPPAGTIAIDPYQIFVKKEPRDPANRADSRNLATAYRFYCGESLKNAHSAEADIVATKEVFLAQVEQYPDLGNTLASITKFLGMGATRNADISGKLIYDENNEVLFNFGKHAGKKVKNERSYAEWMMKSDFPADTKEVLKKILASRK
mgnify:CR=1 FL=1